MNEVNFVAAIEDVQRSAGGPLKREKYHAIKKSNQSINQSIIDS